VLTACDRIQPRANLTSNIPAVPDETQPKREWFPTTHWSLVLSAGKTSGPDAAKALESLCRTYWYPLYAFARREGYDYEESQDLTQEFFSRLLDQSYLAKADPARGRFRSFLLSSFRHMMANERRDAGRQKRGAAVTFSLDAMDPEQRYRVEPLDSSSPAQLFERKWAETILARTLDRLEQDYADRPAHFEELKIFLLGEKGESPYATAAARLGVTEGSLKIVVHRMRRRYGQIFREEIEQTVAETSEVDDEIRHILAILSP